jgi:hypothetical protein
MVFPRPAAARWQIRLRGSGECRQNQQRAECKDQENRDPAPHETTSLAQQDQGRCAYSLIRARWISYGQPELQAGANVREAYRRERISKSARQP